MLKIEFLTFFSSIKKEKETEQREEEGDNGGPSRKQKQERVVADSGGELSLPIRQTRRVRDPLRPLLPRRFSHLQRSR